MTISEPRPRGDVVVPPRDLTPEQALARVVELRPKLVEQQAETERRTYYSEEIHAAFLEAGLYRMLQPRRYGGYEFDLPSFLAVITSTARGCMSTAWCLCLPAGHALQVGAWWPEEAQREIFATGDFRGPMTAAPGGTARRLEDGSWLVNSQHPYCSGAPYSTHFVGQLFEAPGPPTGQDLLFIAPREAYTVLDDWGDSLGLKGSGSQSLRFEDARIPAHYVLEGKQQIDMDVSNGTPGFELHGNPIYLSRALAFFSLEAAALTVGGALNALDEYERLMRTRKTVGRPPFIPRYQSPDYQRWFGLATARLHAADAIVERTAQLWMETCHRAAAGGEPFTKKDDVLLNMMAREALKLAWHTVQGTIYRTAGSSASKNGERLERCFRDLAQSWGHINTILQDYMARDWSGEHFGLAEV